MSLPASDNFAGVALSGSWTTQVGGFVVASGKVTGTAGNNDSAAFWNADVFPNDQFCQATVLSAAGPNWIGVTCRAAGTGASDSFYCFRGGESGIGLEIFKIINGTYTSLIVNAGGSVVANDVIKLTVVGTTLTAFKNGTQVLTATDSSLTSGSAGIYQYGQVAASDGLGVWSGGSAAVAPILITPQPRCIFVLP